MNRREYELKQANCDRWIARIGSSIIFAALVGVYAVLTDLTGWLDPVLFVPFRTIKLPALPVCSVNLQIQVASRNLRPYIRVWFTSRTLHRTGGYNDRR